MSLIRFALLSSLALLTIAAAAQGTEGSMETQALIHTQSKGDVVPDVGSVSLQLNNKVTPLASLTPVRPAGVQIALLIDDGLTRSAGIQLEDIRKFVTTLPPGTEILLGYMTNGTVEVLVPFTTDYAEVMSKVRIPTGMPGQSASPYFCLSEFVKHWPQESDRAKARFVMMLTNGVDPYNGSTRLSNEDSPYVQTAIADAQRAGVAVSSIYYRDAGFRGEMAAMSGQGYLTQVADATGGETYYEGTGSPVSLTPFFQQFEHQIAETYVATFKADPAAGGRDHLVRMKMSTTIPKLKIRHPDEVRPGNRESGGMGAGVSEGGR